MAAGGATAGALSSAIAGGNVIHGAWTGALAGALFGAVGAPQGVTSLYGWSQIAAAAGAGGLVSQLNNGSFARGALFAGVSALSYALVVNANEGEPPTWASGGKVVNKGFQDLSRSSSNNIGASIPPVVDAVSKVEIRSASAAAIEEASHDVIQREGSIVGTFLNRYIFGANSVGTFHDNAVRIFPHDFFVSTLGSVTVNYPTIPVAAAINYAALLNGIPAPAVERATR